MLFLLLLSAHAGEGERAFMEGVYADFYALMYAQALLVLRSRERAQDAVGDSLLALMKKIPLLRSLERNKLRAYVVTTVRNTALTTAMRESRRAEHTRDVPLEDLRDDMGRSPDAAAILDDEISHIKRAIRALPERESAVVMMKFFEQLSDDEIAARMHLRAVTVRSYISRAREHLRDAMAREEAQA